MHHAVAHLEARGGLHPGVGRQNPERGDESAYGHHVGSQQVQPRRHFAAPEQEHTQESGFQEECRNHLIGQDGPEEVGGGVGEVAPVGAKLERHDQARHHAHAKHHGEHLDPEGGKALPVRVASFQRNGFQHRNVAGQPDGEHREDGVKRHHEGKLQPGQKYGIEFHVFPLEKQRLNASLQWNIKQLLILQTRCGQKPSVFTWGLSRWAATSAGAAGVTPGIRSVGARPVLGR